MQPPIGPSHHAHREHLQCVCPGRGGSSPWFLCVRRSHAVDPSTYEQPSRRQQWSAAPGRCSALLCSAPKPNPDRRTGSPTSAQYYVMHPTPCPDDGCRHPRPPEQRTMNTYRTPTRQRAIEAAALTGRMRRWPCMDRSKDIRVVRGATYVQCRTYVTYIPRQI